MLLACQNKLLFQDKEMLFVIASLDSSSKQWALIKAYEIEALRNDRDMLMYIAGLSSSEEQRIFIAAYEMGITKGTYPFEILMAQKTYEEQVEILQACLNKYIRNSKEDLDYIASQQGRIQKIKARYVLEERYKPLIDNEIIAQDLENQQKASILKNTLNSYLDSNNIAGFMRLYNETSNDVLMLVGEEQVPKR